MKRRLTLWRIVFEGRHRMAELLRDDCGVANGPPSDVAPDPWRLAAVYAGCRHEDETMIAISKTLNGERLMGRNPDA